MKDLLPIPSYTADDFINTSKPYEFLYQYKDDKFALQQMCQKLKAAAGGVGVRCFMTLWNAYLETQQKQSGVRTDSATDFDGQPIELLCGEYVCNEHGVVLIDKFGYTMTICRHPIMPIRRLINVDSGEERLELAYKKGRTWRTIIVEKSVIASSNQILQLAAYGVVVNSENAKALSTYLLDLEELNYENITEQKSVGRLGWVYEHGFSPYVDNLIFDGESNYKHIFGAVRSNGSRGKWLDVMKKIRAEKGTGRLFLAASFASVILEPCGLLPFFLHAWGGTEVGKTVGLMIAASVWASPKMGDYITTFNSTSVGQEMTATFLNSLPMCIDELQIQSSQGIKDFDKIIYTLTEGIGKTRGAKLGGLQKINTWKNCIITNGEHPISNANSGGGAVNRVIEFEVDEKVCADLVGTVAIITENYGWAGREFVEFLQKDGSFEMVNALQKDYYRELLKGEGTDKQAASASAILAADALVTQLIFDDGNELTIPEITKYLTKRSDVDANERTLTFIQELVSRNPMHFSADDFGNYRAEVWGKIDSEYYYIIKSVFDRELLNAGYNPTSFLAWAKRRGYLDCDKDGRRTKKAKIANTFVNTVCLLKNAGSE